MSAGRPNCPGEIMSEQMLVVIAIGLPMLLIGVGIVWYARDQKILCQGRPVVL